MQNDQKANAAALRRVVNLLGLGSSVPASDEQLLNSLGIVLDLAAQEIAACKKVIQNHAKANIARLLEEAGMPAPQVMIAGEWRDADPAVVAAARPDLPKVPCPICGGEAAGHLDALRRAYFIPQSLMKQE